MMANSDEDGLGLPENPIYSNYSKHVEGTYEHPTRIGTIAGEVARKYTPRPTAARRISGR